MAAPSRPFVVGLTGGIGSGKSVVAASFAARGVEVIDTDLISRELVAPGSKALQRITAHFGAALLQPDGSLDRARLRQLVFKDATARRWLEALLHPLIRQCVAERVAQSHASWVLLVVPLLLESDGYEWVDRVLVVDVAEATQLARTHERDGGELATIAAIMHGQLTRGLRLAQADDVIDNSGSLADLEPQVAALAARYEELADNDRHQTG